MIYGPKTSILDQDDMPSNLVSHPNLIRTVKRLFTVIMPNNRYRGLCVSYAQIIFNVNAYISFTFTSVYKHFKLGDEGYLLRRHHFKTALLSNAQAHVILDLHLRKRIQMFLNITSLFLYQTL